MKTMLAAALGLVLPAVPALAETAAAPLTPAPPLTIGVNAAVPAHPIAKPAKRRMGRQWLRGTPILANDSAIRINGVGEVLLEDR